MPTPHILIVDDDPMTIKLITKILVHEGMSIQSANSGEMALHMLQHQPFDMVILDIVLPDISGYALADSIRSKDLKLPLIFLSGKSDEADVIRGLSHGVDSYITKPFSPSLLVAQVKLRLQRFKDFNQTDCNDGPDDTNWFLDVGPFRMDIQKDILYKDGREIRLTIKEFSIMKFLMENPDHVFSKESIYQAVWNTTTNDAHNVTVHILYLRSKIEDDPHIPKHIHNVRGKGYKLIP